MNSRTAAVVPMLVAVGAVALFTALGFWQLGRADFKRDLAADYRRHAASGPTAVSSAGALNGLPRFAPVSVTGRFMASRQIYLDNRIRQGRAGVHVFTPLALSDGGVVLVNRGWLPLTDRAAPLPPAPAPAGHVSLQGLVAEPPATGIRLGEAPPSPDWPWLTPYLTISDAERALGRRLSDRVILLAEGEAHGFPRDWEPDTLTPRRHLGYAFQWFAMAAAVSVIWVVMGWRSRRARQEGNP